MDKTKNEILEIEQAILELRLAEREFYRESILSIKNRYRKIMLLTLFAGLGGALLFGVLYCQLIHCPLV